MSDQDTTPTEPTPTPDQPPQPAATDLAAQSKPTHGFWWGTGRRKSAIARVRIRPGKGHFLVNGRKVDQFFTKPQDRQDMWAPLELVKIKDKVDVYVRVKGGGTTGQAGAILLGLSRALKNYDSALESPLRSAGFLTRDAREVERKKYGQPGARRRFQFSKR